MYVGSFFQSTILPGKTYGLFRLLFRIFICWWIFNVCTLCASLSPLSKKARRLIHYTLDQRAVFLYEPFHPIHISFHVTFKFPFICENPYSRRWKIKQDAITSDVLCQICESPRIARAPVEKHWTRSYPLPKWRVGLKGRNEAEEVNSRQHDHWIESKKGSRREECRTFAGYMEWNRPDEKRVRYVNENRDDNIDEKNAITTSTVWK